MCKLLKKFKKKINKNEIDKLFLLIRWENNIPQIVLKSNNSNILYKLLDISRNEEIVTEEEYFNIKNLKK